MNPVTCPGCGRLCTSHRVIDLDPAKQAMAVEASDIVLCLNCGEILGFSSDMSTLRTVELKDLLGLDSWQHQILDIAQKEIKRRGPIKTKGVP